MVEAINVDNFNAKVNQGGDTVVVKFWSEHCGPCKPYGKVFEEFATIKPQYVKCYQVDAIEELPISQSLQVMKAPTTIVFKDGKEIKRVVGAQTLEQLNDLVKDN